MIVQHPVISPQIMPPSYSIQKPIEDRPKDINYSVVGNNLASVDIIVSRYYNNAASSIRENSQEYIYLFEKCPWVKNFLQTASQLNDVKSLLPYYSEINRLIVQKDFYLCNLFLREIRAKELSNVLLVGLLRLTFSWKNHLPNWEILFNNAKKELSDRGYDGDSMLRGLV